MVYILLFLFLVNTSFFFKKVFDNKIEQNFFISVFSYIIVLFVFGLFNRLDLGFITVLLINLGLLGYNCYSIFKKKIKISSVFTFGFILFCLGYLVSIWVTYDRVAYIWDEFSHWAIVVKNMFSLNNFGFGNDSTVIFKKYLSGTSIFQYFCMKLNGEFKESILYLGMNIMLLSTLIPMFSTMPKKNKFFSLILAFFVLLIPTLFYPEVYNSLYVDGILGLTFAYSLYSYFNCRKRELNKFDIVNLTVSYCMLILIKDFGLFLTFISFMIVLIDNAFIREKFSFKNFIRNNYKIILTVIPALLIKVIWMITLKINHISSPWSLDTGSSVLDILRLNFLPYQKSVIYGFLRAIFNTPLTKQTYISFPAITILLVFIIIGYFYVKSSKKEIVNTSKLVSSGVVVGAVVYGGLLLLAYVVVFNEYEAMRLASYERYMATYALGGVIALIALLIRNVSDDAKKLSVLTIVLMTVFIGIYNFTILESILLGERFGEDRRFREPYQVMVSKVNKHLDKKDHLYFISTNTSGLDFYTSRFELTPIRLNDDLFSWSIGEPYNDGDIWTKNITVDEWRKELLDDYTYVYLYKVDEEFLNKYGDLFTTDSIQDNQLYKVLPSDEYAILELVE